MKGFLVRNRFLWPIIKPIAQIGYDLVKMKEKIDLKRTQKLNHIRFSALFAEKIVIHGIFKGLKYPKISAFGSAIYPKLLGSYEAELHEDLIIMGLEKYDNIIDIGCAEGYYAVGFSLVNSHARIYAFDINEEALSQCNEMAKLNNVSDRIFVRKVFNSEDIKTIIASGKTLIFCDCEGCEEIFFRRFDINDFNNCDLIIEAHDFISLNISDQLEAFFSSTHVVRRISSKDDFQKVKTYKFSEIDCFCLNDKRILLSENRPCTMEWLICTFRHSEISRK